MKEMVPYTLGRVTSQEDGMDEFSMTSKRKRPASSLSAAVPKKLVELLLSLPIETYSFVDEERFKAVGLGCRHFHEYEILDVLVAGDLWC